MRTNMQKKYSLTWWFLTGKDWKKIDKMVGLKTKRIAARLIDHLAFKIGYIL